MLNELLIAERGATRAGLRMDELHPDIKSASQVPTLVVRLGSDGRVDSVHPLPDAVVAWTLRDGQHNSFPFVQPKAPLWVASQRASKAEEDPREIILPMAKGAKINPEAVKEWTNKRLLTRVQERLEVLKSGRDGPAATAAAAMERFCLAARDGHQLASQIAERLVRELRQTAQDDWVRVAVALLLGADGRRSGGQPAGGAILFDAAGAALPIYHRDVAASVSAALRTAGASAQDGEVGRCALTGERGKLVTGNFPQPTLPVLGQTFLFARNRDIPSSARYGRFGPDSMPVAEGMAIRLAATIRTLTSDDRLGRTWRPVPGERPQQTDLLLAFVEDDPLAPIAGTLADDGAGEREDAADSPAAMAAAAIAEFETRTRRLLEAVRGKADSDFRASPVRFAVFRKVDPANRKIVYAGRVGVGDLYEAALSWARGERCVPSWMTLPVTVKGGGAKPAAPPHVSPLGLIAFTRAVFRRGGTERSEAVGIPASAAMRLFLDDDRRLTVGVLRLVLARRAALGAGAAHATRRGRRFWTAFDTREALRTVSVLGVLLNKLGKEDPMSDAAFKLGQLLAVADVVHAGYCADVRNGDTPPSLLGNQVFTLAQRSPAAALAALGRRWKPYAGWVKRANQIHQKASDLVDSKKPEKVRRGWTMRRAVRQGREVQSICASLAAELSECAVDDLFRAELLLGYMAGLPQASPGSASDDAHDDQEN